MLESRRYSLQRFLSFVVVAFVMLCAMAVTPATVIERCGSTLNSSPSVTVKFTVVNEAGEELPSSLIVSGRQFRLSTSGMEVWYDGSTQWTYYSAGDQLSISEPTPEELLECNPLAVVDNWKKLYNATSTGRANEVMLESKSRSAAVRSILLTANASTSLPEKLLVSFSNGQMATILVKSILKGKAVPASTFKYDSRRYPASEIVDLR